MEGNFKLSQNLILSLIFFASIVFGGNNASALDSPSGQVILNVSGKITVFNAGNSAEFDLAMLERMKKTGFSTTTPWFDGVTTFEGVLLRDLMEILGANGSIVVAIAANDYRANIPVSDFEDFDVILAYKKNGKYMTLRDNGPLFIVYPFDESPELNRQKYFGRSVWQLGQILVN